LDKAVVLKFDRFDNDVWSNWRQSLESVVRWCHAFATLWNRIAGVEFVARLARHPRW
jgi:hypothetical protein